MLLCYRLELIVIKERRISFYHVNMQDSLTSNETIFLHRINIFLQHKWHYRIYPLLILREKVAPWKRRLCDAEIQRIFIVRSGRRTPSISRKPTWRWRRRRIGRQRRCSRTGETLSELGKVFFFTRKWRRREAWRSIAAAGQSFESRIAMIKWLGQPCYVTETNDRGIVHTVLRSSIVSHLRLFRHLKEAREKKCVLFCAALIGKSWTRRTSLRKWHILSHFRCKPIDGQKLQGTNFSQ